MPDVYNLGRATGLSAWEVYVRQSLLLNPDIEPLSEREWLSETIGLGDSMLLKITADSDQGVHFRDYQLPDNSLLGAPRTIIGSFFNGEGESDTNSWCKKVTSYGPAISNTEESSPAVGTHTAHELPNNITTLDETTKKRMMQYIKIQDAVILQDGVWSETETESPKKDFVPDITKPPLLRITFKDRIREDFYLLLTGFVNRAIIKGEVGFEMGSVIPDDPNDASAYRPQNGDFLGPTLYPWANKVVFTYPGILTALLQEGLKSTSENLEIKNEEDSTETSFKVSKIKPGLGIRVDDPSTKENPAQDITISSRVSSKNSYLRVEQYALDKDDSAQSIPTELQVSEPKPGDGIGITPPENYGDPYKIGAVMDTTGSGSKYIGISQDSKTDASQAATKLIPSYAKAGDGIGIQHPESPGDSFVITSRTTVKGDGSSYLRVTQTAKESNTKITDSSKVPSTTELQPSRPTSGLGVGITPPSSPGENYEISAMIETSGCGSKYLSITQPADSDRSADTPSTSIIPSKITPGDGVAITQPKSPGGDVIISSKIKVDGDAKNYLALTQTAPDSGCGCGCGNGGSAEDYSTTIKPSQIISDGPTSRVVVEQPVKPGDPIRVKTNISFHAHKGISIWDDQAGESREDRTEIGSVVHVGSVIAMGADVVDTTGSTTNDVDLADANNLSDSSPLKSVIKSLGHYGMRVDQLSIEERSKDETNRLDEPSSFFRMSEMIADPKDGPVIEIEVPVTREDGTETTKIIDVLKTRANPSDIKDDFNLTVTEAQINSGKEYPPIFKITYDPNKPDNHIRPGYPIQYSLDYDELARRLLRTGPLANFIQDLLDKIYPPGAKVADDGHIIWPEGTAKYKIPIADLNIYSNDGEGETFDHAIRSRPGNTENDLRMK